MKWILTLFLSLSLKISAQIYFNTRIDPNQSWTDAAFSLVVDSNAINIAFGTYPNGQSNPPLSTAMIILNYSGNIINTNFYSLPTHNTYAGGPGNLSSVSGGGFILGCSDVDSTGESNAQLLRINDNGNIIWVRTYGLPGFQSGWMAKESADGGFLLCGETDIPNGRNDALFLKTDSLGNLLWWRTYGDTSSWELAFAFTQTLDGGYALAGRNRWSGNGSDLWVLKIDNQGIKQWDIIVPTHFTQSDNAWSVITTQDGSIVAAGTHTIASQTYQAYIIKLDLLGNTMWTKMYFTGYNDSEIHSIRELTDGSLIATGFYNNGASTVTHGGFILKTSSNGDSLWAYEYSLEPNSVHRLEDIYPAPDGGFVACGFINIHPPDTGHQDLWVLKVDSNGCEVANCVIGVDELTKAFNPLSVFPVPFSSTLTVEHKLSQKDGVLQAFDVNGRLMEERSFHSSKESFDTSDWPDGMYFLRLLQDGHVYSAKAVRASD